MRIDAVIKAAIQNADADLCNHILWARTPYPFTIDARSLYKAASRFARAGKNSVMLCDHCDNKADYNRFTCKKCASQLNWADKA